MIDLTGELHFDLNYFLESIKVRMLYGFAPLFDGWSFNFPAKQLCREFN